MKTLTKVLATVTGIVGLIGPAVTPAIGTWISGHPNASAIISAVAVILALFHDPKAAPAA